MICVVVALRPEAQPMIDHFRLVPLGSDAPSRLFAGPEILLAVSGVGADAARRAVALIGDRLPDARDTAWLNVGLAGHRFHEIGSAFLADRVEEAASGAVFEVPRIEGRALPPFKEVITVAQVESDYPRDALYDMEAAAFCAAVTRRAPESRVAILKIVSDNREHLPRKVTAAAARRLVREALPSICRVRAAIG